MAFYENYTDVLRQLQSYGLLVSDLQIDTTRPIRCGVDTGLCPVDNAKRKSAGWYHLTTFTAGQKTYIVGAYGFWKGSDNNKEKVELDKTIEITPEQRKAQAERMKQMDKAAKKAREEEVANASKRAQWIWSKYSRDGQSDYLERKGVKPYGVRFGPQNTVAVPITDASGKIFGLQFIRSDAAIKGTKKIQKKFEAKGLAISGHFHLIGSPREVCLIAEGYATAATLHETTGLPVAVAFNANNMAPVAKSIKASYQNTMIIACADDDYLQKCQAPTGKKDAKGRDILCGHYTLVENPVCSHCGKPHKAKNAGVTEAEKAINLVGGRMVVPDFKIDGDDIRNGEKLTDFNDLAMHPQGGPHLVKAQIEAVTKDIVITTSSTPAGVPQQGEGEARPQALSYMDVSDLVERFIYVDDVHGDNAFDSWTKEVVKVKKVQSLLPPRVRWDDVKSHPVWQGRAVYRDQIGFDPTESDSNIICNRWSGWPTKPSPEQDVDKNYEQCKNLLSLLEYLCNKEQNGTEVFEWIIKWLAYPIQNPGAKMDTALIFHGPQGTGKNLFFDAYGRIFGEHFSIITQDTMEDQFNSDWVDRKLFVLADEIVAAIERTHVKNKLKTMITGDRIRINQKMIAAYPEKNFFNMVFLSNEANPVVLERRDRRYLTIWTPEAWHPEIYQAVRSEIDNGGIEALHRFMLSVDLTGFTKHEKPPMTKAKQDLILLNADTPYVFYHEWKEGHLGVPFGPAPSDLIYKLYRKWCDQQGEKWIKTSRQFLSSLKSEGVRNEKENRRHNYLQDSGNTKSMFYKPPIKHIEEAKLNMEVRVLDEQNMTEYGTKLDFFTTCYMEIEKVFEENY